MAFMASAVVSLTCAFGTVLRSVIERSEFFSHYSSLMTHILKYKSPPVGGTKAKSVFKARRKKHLRPLYKSSSCQAHTRWANKKLSYIWHTAKNPLSGQQQHFYKHVHKTIQREMYINAGLYPKVHLECVSGQVPLAENHLIRKWKAGFCQIHRRTGSMRFLYFWIQSGRPA